MKRKLWILDFNMQNQVKTKWLLTKKTNKKTKQTNKGMSLTFNTG